MYATTSKPNNKEGRNLAKRCYNKQVKHSSCLLYFLVLENKYLASCPCLILVNLWKPQLLLQILSLCITFSLPNGSLASVRRGILA